MVLRLSDGRPFKRRALLQMVQGALGTTQAELGAMIGVSRRTIIRWSNRHTVPAPFQVEQLASLVRATGGDDLADSLLEDAGLPIPAPPPAPAPEPPPGPPPQHVVDAVVYAAADAADLAPRAIRLALRAALVRAKELGVELEHLRDALGPVSA